MSGAPSRIVSVESLGDYRDRIDVRSPAEFAHDHVPGATSHPVLTNEERALVGTLHATQSEFVAKRVGAAVVARNIATMLDTAFADKPRDWAPLVYCWRGGKRSAALTHMLNEIGWRAVQLRGGYRAYRRHVREQLESVPARFRYRVVCGLTGSGKSRLVAALAARGAQVLDLEGLASHRGSLLGDIPGAPQPSQKAFESGVLAALQAFDATRPVFVESESKRIGSVQVPEALLAAMRGAPCVRVDMPLALRVALLVEEYAHFLQDPDMLADRLAPLVPLHGRAVIERWTAHAQRGEWQALVHDLLARHYDPTYARSIDRNFPRQRDAVVVSPDAIAPAAFAALADAVVRMLDAPVTAPIAA